MPYSKLWNSAEPGCLIVLVDQSGSMGEPIADNVPRRGESPRKADAVADILNDILHEIVLAGTFGEQVRPRAEIAVIGYGGEAIRSALAESVPHSANGLATLPEVAANPVAVDEIQIENVDESGELDSYTEQRPVWVRPVADGGTPMCAALRRARQMASRWVLAHPESFPPVVINITDGISTDGDPAGEAAALRQVATNDGELLLFNCHITEYGLARQPIAYPRAETELPDDPYAGVMFEASSVIPEQLRYDFEAAAGRPFEPGTRGYIFNGDVASVRNLLKFGSVPATRPPARPNPNM